VLEIRNLCAGYSDKPVLKDISVTAADGKVTVLFGPNGCGKSTFLKAVCGLLPVFEGTAVINNEELLSMDAKELAKRVTYLAQSRQIPDITVQRLVLHGRFPYLSYPRRYRAEDYRMAENAMKQMGILDLADTPVANLSGGQRQKVYIAMALAQNTEVILMDEPTTYLDMKHQMQTLRQAKELAEQGKTVLLVVHDIDQAMNTADELVLMNKGNVIIQGTPEEVYLSGKIDEVFSVSLNRVHTGKGWRYFCEEE
jgi:iron complex transport system ATP-binding protein